jgi:hypothetical protein
MGLSRETKHWVLDGERGMGWERQRRGSAGFEETVPSGTTLGRGWGENCRKKYPRTLWGQLQTLWRGWRVNLG